MTQENLFFIALVLPEPERSVIQQIKEKCAVEYGAVHALKSPPHITLIPPFRIAKQDEGLVFSFLEDFATGCRPFSLSVNGFGCYKPRVIFANPVPEVTMAALHEKLDARFYEIISAKRPERKEFHPHITIAFKDLTPRIFNDAWKIFKNKPLIFSFQIDSLALLKHDDQRWNIQKEFVFRPYGLQN